MKLKTNWKSYIENIRTREINIILPYLKRRNIVKGLEMGAGTGFQSRLLINYIENLYCTELNEERLYKEKVNGIKYIIADAEIVDTYFETEFFDLVFSSNLLEHLPSPEKAIRGIKKILKFDGIAIHIIPSPFIAIIRILLWYPNLAVSLLNRIFNPKTRKNSRIRITKPKHVGNNLKLDRIISKWAGLLIPQPHAVSSNVIEEINYCKKKYWIRLFNENGFRVKLVLKGPVSSGFGFGFQKTARLLEKFCLTSEYIYVMSKK